MATPRSDFARLHPMGFYISGARAWPFNGLYGVPPRRRRVLGSVRVAPPPRFAHERVFVYARPPLKRSDELVVFRRCADIGAAYEVRRDWSDARACALTAYDSDDDDTFHDFAEFYDALARGDE